MKIALAAAGFITGNTEYNRNKIISVIEQAKGQADVLVFGESFLQGFECLSWNYDTDKKIAVSQGDRVIRKISKAARKNGVAVSFGYIEKDGDTLYSSQLTIDKKGDIVNNFRRVTVGWKTRSADGHYLEGAEFPLFTLEDKRFSIGLCGDFWEDENCAAVRNLGADLVLWPVYTDYVPADWNTTVKTEYAEQAAKAGDNVLFVNSCCLDPGAQGVAMGGAAWFKEGKIELEAPAGKECVLVVEV